MKLLMVMVEGTPKIGILTDKNRVMILRGAPASLDDLIQRHQDLIPQLAQVTSAPSIPYNEAEILAPLTRPGKIICIGLNYADHAAEQDIANPPERPLIFNKFNTSIIGPNDEITWPSDVSNDIDYEAELAVVIGKRAKNVSAADAMDYIFGYTIINDVTARDIQKGDKQWIRGKSFDTFCPMGPVIVTANEIADPHDLAISLDINGEVLQDSNTSNLIHRIPQLIEHISRTSTLMPGDLISTGTPSGVGAYRTPRRWLRPGDTVQVHVEGIGILRNVVV